MNLGSVNLPNLIGFGSRRGVVFLIPRERKPMPNDPYAEFETALTDLLTERDGFLERRIILAAARSAVNKEDPRYREALESSFSLLDSLHLTSL
jgi:hypothetical protein